MAGRLHALRRRRRTAIPAGESDGTVRPKGARRSVSARAAAVRARVDDTRQRLESQRPTNWAVDSAFRWVQLQSEAGGALLAGAIAFRIFLFLLPCVLAVVTGLGIGADLAHTDARDVARTFGMAGLAATAVQSGATTSSTARWVTFGFALFALVLGARNLLRALLVMHGLIWRVPVAKRRHLTGISLLAIAIFLAGTQVLRLVYGTRTVSILVWVVAVALFTVVPAAMWLLGSLVLFPRAEGTSWRDLVPGAVLFGVGVEGLHIATIVWFAPYLQSKSQTYGAIGAALAILVWAYLLGRVVTAAVALNAVLWRRAHNTGQNTGQNTG
jgi:uncharacterized BrkB/YihY/UPF0761 family membrane protein